MLGRLRNWIRPGHLGGGVRSGDVININGDDSDVNLLDPSADNEPIICDNNILEITDDIVVPPTTLSSVTPPSDGRLNTTSDVSAVIPSNTETPGGCLEGACLPPSIPSEQDAAAAARQQSASRRERANRHRSRRHRSSSSRHRLCRCKRKETNFLASMCSMICVVLVCTSLAEPEWMYISGGRCVDFRGQPVSYLGVKLFFYKGAFVNNIRDWVPPPGFSPVSSPQSIYYYGTSHEDVLIDCVTPTIVFVMKCIITNCFMVIIFSMTAFILDLVGPTHRALRAMRTNALFSVVSACVCVIINGLSYLATEQLAAFFQKYPLRDGSKIDVEFSMSFYIITAAGAISVIGTACNLLRKTSSNEHRGSSSSSEHRERHLADLSAVEANISACSQLAFLPSPPPYSP